MATSRTLKWTLLTVLLMATFFLASFNATLRYIVAQRRELAEENRKEAERKVEERKVWEEAAAEEKLKKEKSKNKEGGGGKGVGDKITPGNDRAADERYGPTNPESSSSSESSIQKSEELEEEVSRRQEQISDQVQEALDKSREEHLEALRREQENPTPGRHRSTLREAMAPEVWQFGRDHPRNRSPNESSSSYSDGSATKMLADAHYAKALRMLSSPFDRLKNGGNALPDEVHEGEYDQEIGNGDGRGEKFVKMDVTGGKRRKKLLQEQKKERKRRHGSRPMPSKAEDPGVVLVVAGLLSDVLLDWYDDFFELVDEISYPLASWILGKEVRPKASSHREEDEFSWKDTQVGSQLIWIYGKVAGMWSRKKTDVPPAPAAKKSSSGSDSSAKKEEGESDQFTLNRQDRLAREGLFHLEKAAELGHSEAQRVVANSLASGILPLSDHSLMHRLAEQEYHHLPNDSPMKNWTSILLKSTLEVPDDFSTGGSQLSRALLLWHLSAMDGNVESAMALGYRHLYSATGGRTHVSDLVDDKVISSSYHPVHGGPIGHSGSASNSHYGVMGTCGTALAYYEAAAHGVMDELEAGPTKGKVNPPIDEHRLAEIYAHGGASVALDANNKPDELEEALQYYRMLASRSRSPEPDLVAAFTIANFYFNGYRGVKQDLRLALKYYEICGDYNHWEGGGQAGLMHTWGIGMAPEERDLGKAYRYFAQGTPGGLDSCMERLRRKKRQNNKQLGSGDEVVLCDRYCINGMGLLHLLGVDGLVDRNVNLARRWFEHGKEFGDADSRYNYAMMRLGWMVAELEDIPKTNVTKMLEDEQKTEKPFKHKTAFDQNYMIYRHAPSESLGKDEEYNGPTSSDYNVAIQELQNAASKGHLQAKHKLGILYASGASVPKKGRHSKAVTQSCVTALRHFKSVADAGHTVSRRNRAAWKQYNAGDYESSLRNYLASAETGSEVGQVNAAFLLEQGYCLGMTRGACTSASVRLWRAAARQGNLEACLRVGDFYYYGRMRSSSLDKGGLRSRAPSKTAVEGGEKETLYDREVYLASLEARAFYFMPGPYRWTRYVLYPEELLAVMRKWAVKSGRSLVERLSSNTTEEVEVEGDASTEGTCSEEEEGTCSPEWARDEDSQDELDEEEYEHMAIAAQYYRKAAEEHKSARANFNLGFMHEWGLGLAQDFPLAKRHYDLAGENGGTNMASVIALYAMNLHQKWVRLGMFLREYASSHDYDVGSGRQAWEEFYESFASHRVDGYGHVGGATIPEDEPEEKVTASSEGGGRHLGFERKITTVTARGETITTKSSYVPTEDVINDMKGSPMGVGPRGTFPDNFEDGFDQLGWRAHMWKIKESDELTPFETKYSAFLNGQEVRDDKRATLRLDINSGNGGRICFALFADIAMPWWDFRISLDSIDTTYQFSHGTTDYYSWTPKLRPDKTAGWVDVCFDIIAGKHFLEWSMASPSFYDKNYAKQTMDLWLKSYTKKKLPSGQVLLDNVRFFPFVYDGFESGDFSTTKWKQNGSGGPWVISDEYAIGRYSAHASPTVDFPSGQSNLELIVDLGYTGAMLTFRIKIRSGIGIDNAVWLKLDGTKVRPWYGDDGEFHIYTQYIQEGIHVLTWSFDYKGDDPEVGVWLDEVRFYTRENTQVLAPSPYRQLGWKGGQRPLSDRTRGI